MQKRYDKIIVISLICCLLSTMILGCSKTSKNKEQASTQASACKVINDIPLVDTSDYYKEESITLPDIKENEYIIAVRSLPDGTIKAVTSYTDNEKQKLYRIYTQKDESWTAEDAGWEHPDTPEISLINFTVLSHDWYLLYFSSETSEYQLYHFNEEAKSTSDITPDCWKDEFSDHNNNFVSMLEVINNDTILYYVSGFNELHEYHPADGADEVISQDHINSMTLFDHKLYYICETNRVKALDLDSHDVTQDIELNEVNDLPQLTLDSAGNIYVISGKGILLYQPDKQNWCRLLQGSECSFSSNLITSTAASQASDNSLYIAFNGTDRGFSRISRQTEEKKPEKRVLTIYSAYNWTGLSQDIVRYMMKHNDVKIELKEALDIESESELLDAEIRSVNTSLLAGEGADIYILDHLPADEYIKNGILQDLSPLFETQLKVGAFLDPVVDYYTQDSGAIYSLPLRICPMYYIYRDIVKTEHPSFNQLMDIFHSTPDICYVSADSLKDVITFYMKTYASTDLIQNGKFCVDQWKKVVNDMQCLKGHTYENCHTVSIEEDGYLVYLPTGHCLFGGKPFSSSGDLIEQLSPRSPIRCHSEPANNSFSPYLTLGINAHAKNKADAEEFLKYLFSDEVQSKEPPTLSGFPVLKKPLQDMINFNILVDHECHSGVGDVVSFTFERSSSDTEFAAQVYQSFIDLKHITMQDTTLLNLLVDETYQCLEENLDIDACADKLESKVNLYLAE